MTTKKDKIYSMISLSRKAGKVMAGSDVCESGLKSGKVCLLLLSEDSSEGTAKKFKDLCIERKIEYRVFGESCNLGKYFGKDKIVVLGICDKGLSDSISKLIDDSFNIGGNI